MQTTLHKKVADELIAFANARKSDRVFIGFNPADYQHRQFIRMRLLSGLLFYSRNKEGRLDGVLIVTFKGNNKFFVEQLVADTAEARVAVGTEFVNKFPGCVVEGYDRKGKLHKVKDSAKFLKHILHKGYGKISR